MQQADGFLGASVLSRDGLQEGFKLSLGRDEDLFVGDLAAADALGGVAQNNARGDGILEDGAEDLDILVEGRSGDALAASGRPSFAVAGRDVGDGAFAEGRVDTLEAMRDACGGGGLQVPVVDVIPTLGVDLEGLLAFGGCGFELTDLFPELLQAAFGELAVLRSERFSNLLSVSLNQRVIRTR